MSTWILLRGLMREQRHWGGFPAVLAQALKADGAPLHIVTPDLPGNGQRHALRSPTRVTEMVAFCRSELLARGLAPPYNVLALSLGGMAAVEWASQHPQEVARLVLINTSMRPYSPFYQRLRWQNYPTILRQLVTGGVAQQEAMILRLTSQLAGAGTSADAGAQLVQRWVGYQREYPVSQANALRQLWAAARFRAPATRPPVPLLVLASQGDRLVDHHCSLRLAAAWDAPLRLHPSAGHDLPLDDGAWVAQAVADWLADGRGA
jgi:pimeloyl-ACP methyl ester carboxylesterase